MPVWVSAWGSFSCSIGAGGWASRSSSLGDGCAPSDGCPSDRRNKLDEVLVKVRNQWMAIIASVWLFVGIAALISGNLPEAAVCGVIMLLTLDSYRRDRRRRVREAVMQHREA